MATIDMSTIDQVEIPDEIMYKLYVDMYMDVYHNSNIKDIIASTNQIIKTTKTLALSSTYKLSLTDSICKLNLQKDVKYHGILDIEILNVNPADISSIIIYLEKETFRDEKMNKMCKDVVSKTGYYPLSFPPIFKNTVCHPQSIRKNYLEIFKYTNLTDNKVIFDTPLLFLPRYYHQVSPFSLEVNFTNDYLVKSLINTENVRKSYEIKVTYFQLDDKIKDDVCLLYKTFDSQGT